jgi:hypothetical protein
MQQAVDGLESEKHGGSGDKGRLSQRSQRLGLAVSEAVIGIGRLQRPAHGEQIDEGSPRIHDRVHQRGQYADRTGSEPGRQLGHNQQGRCHDGSGSRDP